MSIEIQGLHKAFGPVVVCDHLDLAVADGELLALLGPSGSGKTTLLRSIAGLEQPDGGRLLLDGRDATRTDVRRRQVGFVFQHYALFGHMTVAENVAFGLRVRPRASRPPEAEIRRRAAELLQRVQLGELGRRYPHQLSGGQRQRVALARALAVEPRVLLLDEPFGALDAQVRKSLRRWLRQLHDEVQLTTVFVTHDQEEAMEVADRVVVMNRGRIEQVGTPAELQQNPATPFVLQFLSDVAPWGDGYVRPQDLRVHAAPGPGTVAVRLGQVIHGGLHTRLACHRADSGDALEVALPQDEARLLQAQALLQPGGLLHLRAAQVQRFGA